MNKKFVFLFFISFILISSGCTPSASSVQTAIAQTQESEFTSIGTDVKSDGLDSPTMTTKPENTKEPTPLPATPTTKPSSTPEPTLSPDPLDLTGIGDSVVDIDWPDTLGLLTVKANSAGNYFGLVPYDENGSRMSSFVNTTDPYNGFQPFNFNGDYVTRLEVSATGEWSIRIAPIHEANKFTVPGTYSGRDDDVIILTNGIPDLANISANTQSRHFSVVPYTSLGKRISSVVNTTDPYEGTVIIPRDAAFLVINGVGDWQISITTVD